MAACPRETAVAGAIARFKEGRYRRNIVKYREKLGYMALGGLLMLVGMLAANLTPLTAQRDSFGEITCTGLKVVDSEGNQRVRLTGYPDGEIVAACDSNGNPRTSLVGFEEGGKIFVLGHGREEHVTIGVDENGGQIVVFDKGGKDRVAMWSTKDGGQFVVYGKDGKPRGDIGVNEYGKGEISTWDRKGNRLATLK